MNDKNIWFKIIQRPVATHGKWSLWEHSLVTFFFLVLRFHMTLSALTICVEYFGNAWVPLSPYFRNSGDPRFTKKWGSVSTYTIRKELDNVIKAPPPNDTLLLSPADYAKCKKMRRPGVAEKAVADPDHQQDFYAISDIFFYLKNQMTRGSCWSLLFREDQKHERLFITMLWMRV